MSNYIDATMQLRLANILKKIPLFSILDDHVIIQLSKTMDTQYFQENCVIFEKGDTANALYIIQSGKVLIYQPDTCNNVGERIAVLGENSFFGEMGLVSQQPRNASARTLEDSLLVVLTKEAFMRLLNENADIASSVMDIYMKRTKSNQKREFVRTQQMDKKKPQWDMILGEMINSIYGPK